MDTRPRRLTRLWPAFLLSVILIALGALTFTALQKAETNSAQPAAQPAPTAGTLTLFNMQGSGAPNAPVQASNRREGRHCRAPRRLRALRSQTAPHS